MGQFLGSRPPTRAWLSSGYERIARSFRNAALIVSTPRSARGGSGHGFTDVRRYTIDASVFVNAFNAGEQGHATSRALLAAIQNAAEPVVVPTLLLVEVASAIARIQHDSLEGVRYASAISALPHVTLISLSATLARNAAEVAANLLVRGSDGVYLVVAEMYATTLISLDKEQLTRGARIATCQTPEQALVHLGG
jgi:predicted nucleic acid-binding protein